MSKSGEEIRKAWAKGKALPRTPAGRMQVLQELLDPNDYDDDGNIIGQHEPLISAEQARKLLQDT